MVPPGSVYARKNLSDGTGLRVLNLPCTTPSLGEHRASRVTGAHLEMMSAMKTAVKITSRAVMTAFSELNCRRGEGRWRGVKACYGDGVHDLGT